MLTARTTHTFKNNHSNTNSNISIQIFLLDCELLNSDKWNISVQITQPNEEGWWSKQKQQEES